MRKKHIIVVYQFINKISNVVNRGRIDRTGICKHLEKKTKLINGRSVDEALDIENYNTQTILSCETIDHLKGKHNS